MTDIRVPHLLWGREPTTIIAAADAGLALVVAFGLGLSTDQTGAVLAVVTALLGAAAAWATRPVAPAVFVGVARAAVALVVAFGLDLAPAQQGSILAAVTVVLALLVRQQVSPASSVSPEVLGRHAVP